jgi:hypothetical protein
MTTAAKFLKASKRSDWHLRAEDGQIQNVWNLIMSELGL